MDRAQCGVLADLIMVVSELGLGIHADVMEKVVNSVFVCWEGV